MIYSYKSLFILSCFFILVSCSKQENAFVYKGAVDDYSEIEIRNVAASPDESYFIYVPTQYDKDQYYPLMLCISPHGKGLRPVEEMKFAAETFGYIVVGSNDIRNNFKGNGEAIRNLIYDVQNKYNIDQSRLYACGFSGGGRIATVLGNQEVVTGVISCGAGPGDWSKADPYPWYGIVGKADFNYNEFAQFNPGVLQQPFFNSAYHNGGHEWPDSSYLYDAIVFLEIHAMKSNTLDGDSALLKGYEHYVVSKVDQFKVKAHYKEAFDFANNAATVLSGMIRTNRLTNLTEQLYRSPEYKMDVEKLAELDKFYNELVNVYPAALTQKDTLWWKKELEKLDNRIKSASEDAAFIFKRTKATLGILCYSYCMQIKEKDNMALKNILLVYELIEPNNPDVYFFWSIYEKNEGDLEKSNQYLEKAKVLGFSDLEKVTG